MKNWLEGAQVTTQAFDPNAPYTYCNLCGEIYQPYRVIEPINTGLRKSWAISHSKSHSSREHQQYEKSGLKFLPEAQIRLAAFGIIEINDNPETHHALRESKPLQENVQRASRKEKSQWDIMK